MALGRSDTAPRALGCAGGRDELPKTYSEGCGNARVLREVLFNYEVVLSRQHVVLSNNVLPPRARHERAGPSRVRTDTSYLFPPMLRCEESPYNMAHHCIGSNAPEQQESARS